MPNGGPSNLYYPVVDYLGSTVGIMDSAGALLSSQQYWPYGAPRSGGVTQTDELFTGQKRENQDTTLGLYNYKARFYSTTVGRFTSADISAQDGLNRFAYVRNNPATFNDPTGHGVTGEDDYGRPYSCPASRPDCLNDGGPPPYKSGPVDPCDANCHFLRGIDAYCHSDAGAHNPSCGGSAGPVAEPAPTPSCPPACAPDARESSGGSPCDVPLLCTVAKQVAKGACSVTTCALILEAVQAAPRVNNMVTSSCFHGVASAVIIVAGGTAGTVVVVAAASSGSLETAAVIIVVSGGSAALNPAQPPPGVANVREGLGNLRDCY